LAALGKPNSERRRTSQRRLKDVDLIVAIHTETRDKELKKLIPREMQLKSLIESLRFDV
jgi:hypothetical protein